MYKNNLNRIRVQNGITLLQLSRISGVSVGYLCHLEKGTRNNPSREVMEKISKALNKTVAEVFFY